LSHWDKQLEQVGEVVPAREGLRLFFVLCETPKIKLVGEVVPAREGLRPSASSAAAAFTLVVGEVVPAREGLRRSASFCKFAAFFASERLFQQEKD